MQGSLSSHLVYKQKLNPKNQRRLEMKKTQRTLRADNSTKEHVLQLAFELADIQVVVKTPGSQQCLVRAALDDPAVTDVAGGSWYPDDRLVFGITVNGVEPGNIIDRLRRNTARLTVRGLAKWRGEDPQGSLAELTDHGRLVITIERGKGRDRYQGIVLADTGEQRWQYFTEGPVRFAPAAWRDRARVRRAPRCPAPMAPRGGHG